ncbi:sulfotransferase domain-containing protein [Candidatus Nitrosopelagicus sp.]|nr:sulfotransferase domain-containing protein [Candidatus Nitrosopelagicus sp.]|tara:strand:+ start:2650 stop:3477 length:828 start_codon:yes stop_codon:yes gene_type:complete
MNKNKIRGYYHRYFKRGVSGITASSRVLPDFIIIGTVRSGSTSLYYNICEHPSVLEAAYDEIGYFDSNYHLGENWYRSMFPTQKMMNKIREDTGYSITGEDTPFYFWKKEVAERILSDMPETKLIVILRNPVDRAYSNYNLAVRENNEKLTFEEAIGEEIEFLSKNSFRETVDRFRSYLTKGMYVNQIKPWLDIFSREQLHFLSTEQMKNEPCETLDLVFKFLSIPSYDIKNLQERKLANYKQMNENTREQLIKYYKSYNEEFFKIINQKFEWDK